MIYNGFYREGVEWIGQAVQDCVTAVNGRAYIYAGLMCSDIKDDFETPWMKPTFTEHRAFHSSLVQMTKCLSN